MLTAEMLRKKLSKELMRVIDLFRRFDNDGSGQIDLAEFTRGLMHAFPQARQGDVEALFHEFDRDGGGTIEVRRRRGSSSSTRMLPHSHAPDVFARRR